MNPITQTSVDIQMRLKLFWKKQFVQNFVKKLNCAKWLKISIQPVTNRTNRAWNTEWNKIFYTESMLLEERFQNLVRNSKSDQY